MAFKKPECYVCGSHDVVGAFNVDGASGWMWFCPEHREEVVAKGEAVLAGKKELR